MRYIPKEKEIFYYISDTGHINNDIRKNFIGHRIKSGNCYRTEQDAERDRDRQYALVELQDLADELNCKTLVNWQDNQQPKFVIIYVYFNNEFDCIEVDNIRSLGEEPVCLDSNFLSYALQRLGEEKLKLIMEV